MSEHDSTKEELIREVERLRSRVASLERADVKRERSEHALRDSERRYRTLFESAGDAIFLEEVTERERKLERI